MPLTPADVHNVAFKKPPIGKRGYDEEEVDAFLDEVDVLLLDRVGACGVGAGARLVGQSLHPLDRLVARAAGADRQGGQEEEGSDPHDSLIPAEPEVSEEQPDQCPG